MHAYNQRDAEESLRQQKLKLQDDLEIKTESVFYPPHINTIHAEVECEDKQPSYIEQFKEFHKHWMGNRVFIKGCALDEEENRAQIIFPNLVTQLVQENDLFNSLREFLEQKAKEDYGEVEIANRMLSLNNEVKFHFLTC